MIQVRKDKEEWLDKIEFEYTYNMCTFVQNVIIYSAIQNGIKVVLDSFEIGS